MIWLVLSILCSSAVAILLRSASVRRTDQFPLFATNYAVALVLGLVLTSRGSLSQEPVAAIVLALCSGVLYVMGFLVLRRTIHEIGTGIAASVSRLSVTGPVVLSILAFGEAVGFLQGLGIVLAIAVLPLSGKSWPPWTPARGTARRGTLDTGGLLWSVALFSVFAVNDGVLKIRTELLPESDAGLFFAILFGSAGVISAAIAAARRQRLSRTTLLIGIPLGAVNYGTVFFLSKGLETLPGYQAFTINSVGVILLVVLVSRVLFGERLARHNYLFLAGSVVAIALLRMPV